MGPMRLSIYGPQEFLSQSSPKNVIHPPDYSTFGGKVFLNLLEPLNSVLPLDGSVDP
jgi:hypothetical protein